MKLQAADSIWCRPPRAPKPHLCCCPARRPLPAPAAKAASGVFAVLASSTSSAVERAAYYLPASLSLRRRGGAGAAATQPPPPPPPLSVPVQLLCGDEVPASATAATTLEELRQACGAAAGVPPPLIRICVQGAASGAAAVGALPARQRHRMEHLGSAEPAALPLSSPPSPVQRSSRSRPWAACCGPQAGARWHAAFRI